MRDKGGVDYDAIVIGGGIMGASTAYALSKRGKRVLLVDQNRIGAPNQSQDYSRFFKYSSLFSHGTRGGGMFYAKLAMESLGLWRRLERESGRRLFFRSGFLLLRMRGNEGLAERYRLLGRLGMKARLLDREELKRDFPQFNASRGLLEYGAGILGASDAVRAYLDLAGKRGMTLMEGSRALRIEGNSVTLSSGERLRARRIVVTAGSWVTELLRGRYPISVAIQGVLFVKPKKADSFARGRFPLFAYLDEEGFYGVPAHGIGAVKISYDSGRTVDFNSLWFRLCPEALREFGRGASVRLLHSRKIMRLAGECVPGLAGARVVEEKFCTYDNSPDEGFIIDRMGKSVIVATGFSGGGFKFAPVIGRILADLASAGRTSYDISRFSMDRFGKRGRVAAHKYA